MGRKGVSKRKPKKSFSNDSINYGSSNAHPGSSRAADRWSDSSSPGDARKKFRDSLEYAWKDKRHNVIQELIDSISIRKRKD